MANPNWPNFPGVPNMTVDNDGRPQTQDLIPGKQEGTPLEANFFNPLIRKTCDLQDEVDQQKSSLSNYATNASLQQEVQRAQAAEGKLQPAGDYATTVALQQETQRAQAAEAGLLPLTGGAITGPINRAGGGVLPEVLGPNLTGRVVIQTFVATGQIGSGWGHEAWVSFPASFAPNTVPVLALLLNRAGNGRTLLPSLGNSNGRNQPNITNTGFSFQPFEADSATMNSTGWPWTLQVVAIGVMQ